MPKAVCHERSARRCNVSAVKKHRWHRGFENLQLAGWLAGQGPLPLVSTGCSTILAIVLGTLDITHRLLF